MRSKEKCREGETRTEGDQGGAGREQETERVDFSLIQQLQRVSVDVAELCSPPRVTVEAQKFGLKTGEAMDILTGWDFTKDEHKRMA